MAVGSCRGPKCRAVGLYRCVSLVLAFMFIYTGRLAGGMLGCARVKSGYSLRHMLCLMCMVVLTCVMLHSPCRFPIR